MSAESLDGYIYKAIFKHARLSTELKELKEANMKVKEQINAFIVLINKEFQTFIDNIAKLQSYTDKMIEKSNRMEEEKNAEVNNLKVALDRIQMYLKQKLKDNNPERSTEIAKIQEIFENIDKNAVQQIIQAFNDNAFLYVSSKFDTKVEELPYVINS